MKYHTAVEALDKALKNQSTIKVSKLSEILQSLNFSLNKTPDTEVMYLKGEIKKLRQQIRILEKHKRG